MSNPILSSGSSVWNVDKTFQSKFGEAHQLVDDVLAQMTAQGWSDRDVFAVNMALEESISNAIEHGNHGNPQRHFRVTCCVAPNLVNISVHDEGKGFERKLVPNPTEDENLENPSGRGVLLIHGFMTRVWYNDAGNVIYMEKEPSDPS